MTEKEIQDLVDYCEYIGMVALCPETKTGCANLYFPITYLEQYRSLVGKSSKDLIRFIISAIKEEKEFFTFIMKGYADKKMYVATPKGQISAGYEPYLIYSTNLLNYNKASEVIRGVDNDLFYTLRSNGVDLDKEYFSGKEIAKKLFDGFEFPIGEGKNVTIRIIDKGSTDFDFDFEGEGIHVVGVRFVGQESGCYYYLGDNQLYNIGDTVEVYTRNNGRQYAKVVYRNIYKNEKDLPYNKEEMSTIIRKVEK